jgi:ariadne-1
MSFSKRDELKEGFVCQICGDNSSDLVICGMSCNHGFCHNCYQMHMEIHIREGQSSLTMCCPMHNCKTRISTQMIESYCSSQMYLKYREWMLQHFIFSKKNIRYCRNEHCSSLLLRHLSPTEMISFQCTRDMKCLNILNDIGVECRSCSLRMCFECGDEDHYPISCHLLKQWKEMDRQEGQSMNWILVHTKKCPKCKFPIEKNQGCRHMHCRQCSYHFCWDCMHQWDTICGYEKKCPGILLEGYGQESDSKIRKAEKDIQYYMHYFKGYMSQKDSVKHLEKLMKKIQVQQDQYSERTHLVHDTVEYLIPIISMIIQSRNIIKFCYVMNYFMEERKEFLEFIQQELIIKTEYLTHLVEKDFDTLEKIEIINLSRILKSTLSGIHEQFTF